MPIHLTRPQIDAALPSVADGLARYQWIQTQFASNDEAHDDAGFRRRFNRFYRVRRNAAWQATYYALMGRARRDALQFDAVLESLRRTTDRIEASFASKLIATINPDFPVLDKFVLRNVGQCLPAARRSDRVAEVALLHASLKIAFDEYLRTADGRYLVQAFNRLYPDSGITEVKMLDLVLWQTRA